MTSRYKGVLNLQYATNLNKWIFDFTASVNGKARVYDFMKTIKDSDGNLLCADGYTKTYPLLYLQITKRFKGIDLYLGAENLTNFRQKDVIIGTAVADMPASTLPVRILTRVRSGVQLWVRSFISVRDLHFGNKFLQI